MTEYSYNGWPATSTGAGVDRGFSVAGVTFPGGVLAGDVSTVFAYLVNQLHARVEPLVAGWCWGWEYREDVNDPDSMSCHASATAIDYNAPNHPNGGEAYGGWSSAQVSTIREILADLQQSVRWGADYSHTKDPMHFEINTDAATLAAVAADLPNHSGGFLMALTDQQQADLYNWVKDLHGQLIPSGIASGQKSVGSTIAAGLGQSQANANTLKRIEGKL